VYHENNPIAFRLPLRKREEGTQKHIARDFRIIIDTYLFIIYYTNNTPATPLNNAHLGGFFFCKRFLHKFTKSYNISRIS